MRRIPLLLFVLILFSCAALIYASDGITAAQATPISITGPNGVCKKVTNASATGRTEYIPTASIAEWQSFVAHPPAGVTFAACSCALPWGGTVPDGQSVTAYLYSSGSSCPAETRTCAGTVLSGSYTNQTCTIACVGKNCGCTGKGCSDARLKRDITPLAENEGLQSILQLRPVSFFWKDKQDDAESGRQIGFIAQEVARIFPDVVKVGDPIRITLSDGTTETIADPKLMNYQALVVPLVKAVQELQAENDALRARVDMLEAHTRP